MYSLLYILLTWVLRLIRLLWGGHTRFKTLVSKMECPAGYLREKKFGFDMCLSSLEDFGLEVDASIKVCVRC